MKERIKKIFRISVLIGTKQLWELGCNVYQLTREPFLTLKNLQKDRSQKILVAWVVLTPVFLYGVGRIIWDLHKYGKVLIYSYGWVFMTTMLLELGLIIYLAYWSWRVLKDGNS